MKNVVPLFIRAGAAALALVAMPAFAQLPDIGKFAQDQLKEAQKQIDRMREDMEKRQAEEKKKQEEEKKRQEEEQKRLSAEGKKPDAPKQALTPAQQDAERRRQEAEARRQEAEARRQEAESRRQEALRGRNGGATPVAGDADNEEAGHSATSATAPAHEPPGAAPAPARSGGRCAYSLNKGDAYPIGPQVTHVLVTDFDKDGRQDLAVASGDNAAKVSPITILMGDGRGSFDKKPDVITSTPYVTAAGDFDEDGKVDLLVGPAHQSASPQIFPGRGDGTFMDTVLIKMGAYVTGLAVGDFNGDKHLDFAASFVAEPHGVAYFQSTGDLSFPKRGIAGPLGASPLSMAVGDLNGDGRPDLVTTQRAGGTIGVFFGNGDGTFTNPRIKQVLYKPTAVAIGDFNGDRKNDVAVTDDQGNRVAVLLNTGDGALSKATYFDVGQQPRGVVAVDVNADGLTDLVVANGLHTISTLIGNGDGTFQPQQKMDLPGTPNAIALGDFNRDGVPDFAVGLLTANKVQILLGACR